MEASSGPLPPHQFQAQNSHYASEPAQYGPHQSHQSQPTSVQQPAPVASQPPEPKPSASSAGSGGGGGVGGGGNGGRGNGATTAAAPPPPTPAVAAPNATTSTPINKERTRHSSACFPCAKRKVKCDRDVKNPCSNCLKRDQGQLCEVKSQKDRLSHGRPDGSLAARDGHRDKRPKFEAYQSTFRSTPAATNGYLAPQDGNPLTMSPPQARMTEYDSPEYRLPRTQRTSVSMISRKTDEDARWEAIEELLPPRKDLLKYIGTYRSGPHVLSPVTRNFDAIESQVCIFLEELGTPQIRQRLGGTGTNAEVELNRLARLLAVLAAGSRVDDSDAAIQRMVAQDYVRKAFKCLQLANYMLRPTTETAETLFMLAHEMVNECQPGLAWTILGAASRIVQLRDAIPAHYESSPYEPAGGSGISADHAVSIAISLQDAIVSLVLGKATSHNLIQLQQHAPDAPSLGLDITAVLIDVYTAIPEPIYQSIQQQPPRDSRWPAPSPVRLWPEAVSAFHSRLDAITRNFRLADLAACKSIRDRYEHYAFRLHVSWVMAMVQRAALPDRLFSPETQDTPSGRRLELVLQDILRAFLDFSAISNLPVRTWWMVHFALDAALELCGIAQAPDGPFASAWLPRLLGILEAGGMPLLAKRHQDAMTYAGRVCMELEQAEGERMAVRVPPDEVRREVAALRDVLGMGDDYVSGGLVQLGYYGL